MHLSIRITFNAVKTIIIVFIVTKNIALGSGLQCEQSTHKTGRKPPKYFEINDCISFETFQNGIFSEVDQARRGLSDIYKVTNYINNQRRRRQFQKSHSNALNSNKLIVNTEKIPIPVMKQACVAFNVVVMNSHLAPKETKGFVVDIRDCVTFHEEVLDEMLYDYQYNECNKPISLENSHDPHISVLKSFCVCITDNCNGHRI